MLKNAERCDSHMLQLTAAVVNVRVNVRTPGQP